ncbi:MAG: hypothetical protein WBA85_05920 [Brucella anthropi]
MSTSECPADIRAAIDATLEAVSLDSGAPGEGPSLAMIEKAVAHAINQERIRCIELAYKHYVYTPNREGAQALSFAITEGKKA